MATLETVITQLEMIGVFQYALPFLISFAIVYGMLEKIGLFDEQRINGVVAVVAGFFVANYAVGAPGLGIFLSNFFGAFAVVLVFLLAALLAAGIAGYDEGEWRNDYVPRGLMWLGGLAILAVFLSWGGLQLLVPGGFLPSQVFLDTTNLMTLIVIMAAVGLIYVIIQD